MRGVEKERQADVRQALERKFPSGLTFLGKPLRCTRFVRTLYKFSLGPPDHTNAIPPKTTRIELSPVPLPDQCLYIAMATPIEAIDAKFGQLSRLPYIGRERTSLADGLRSVVVRMYLIFYTVEHERIFIVRVIDGRMDVDEEFQR